MSQMCQIVSSHERIVCIFMKMLSKIRNIKKIYRTILRKVRKYMRNPMFLFFAQFFRIVQLFSKTESSFLGYENEFVEELAF